MKLKALPLLIALSATAADAAFIISQPDTNGAFGNAATGQSFTPSVGISPVPGTPPATIDLTGFSFFYNGGANNAGAATNLDTVFLHIYDANPSGTANLVGVSTTSIDLNPTTNFANGDELSWSFANLTLAYNTTYFAVFSKGTTQTDINDVGIGLKIQNTDPYAGGVGLVDNFGSGNIADTKFTATFAIPEPSTALLGGLGLLALLRRRR